MKSFVDFFSVVVLLIIIYIYIESRSSEIIYVESSIDKNKYLVRNLNDKNEAANLLATMRANITKLIDTLVKKYPNKDSVMRLKTKFNPNNMTETEGNSKYTSYSVNKGEKIVLCLRSKDSTEKLIDENTITFVALHEMSHIMTISLNHTEEFWDNFKFLLKEATLIGIYKCVNYDKEPKKYCGIEITQNPMTCANVNPDV